MHGFTNIVVSPERETKIAHATADMRSRQVSLNPSCCTDKVYGIVVVLLHTRGNGQDVRVEDDVQRIHSHLVDQQVVGAFGNLDTPFIRRGLSLFVEAHHHNGRAKPFYVARMLQENLLAFFQ